MREYPPCLWSLLSQVYVDLPFACEESGDLSQPLHEGLLTMDQVSTMGQLLAGQATKPKEGETAFFKTVGMALFDLIAAQGHRPEGHGKRHRTKNPAVTGKEYTR